MSFNILDRFKGLMNSVLSEYGINFAILVLGIIIGLFLKEYVTDRGYRKQVELRIKDKEEYIASLLVIIHDRAKKIAVEEKDKSYFRKILKYFKKGA